MLMFGRIAVLTSCFMILSTPLLAGSKTLLVDGVNAAVHGDLALDKGPWQNDDSFSALRLKVGVQLVRIGFVGLTLGYQKVGFYNAEKNWSKTDANRTHFDYRGPVAELHLFPDHMFSFSVAGHKGQGFSFKRGDDAAALGIDCPETDAACAASTLERSAIDLNELTAQVNYRFSPGLQLFVGAGNRHIKGTPSYEVNRGQGTVTETQFESFSNPSWTVDSQFFLFGLRGSTL